MERATWPGRGARDSNDEVIVRRAIVFIVTGTLLALAAASVSGCQSREEIFTGGRIENRCNGAIPVCGQQAACVLSTDQYIRGTFPGGARVIIRTDVDPARLVTRFLLIDQTFPGTEMQVRAYDTGCGDFDEQLYRDVDLFDLAGDDGTLEYHLDVEGRGDHMVELFSDMGSGYLFQVDIED